MAEEILGNVDPDAALSGDEETTLLTGDENIEDTGDKASGKKAGDDASGENAVQKETDDKSKDDEIDKDKGGAPEKYEDFKLPNGMEIDTEVLAAFEGELKSANLTQEQGQKFIDLQTKLVAKVTDAQQAAWAGQLKDWSSAAESDKEYGGAKFGANIDLARKAMREIGTPELAQALNETGMGNHPEFIRFFVRVGKAISEDGVVIGKGRQAVQRSQAERIFPNHNKAAS